MAKKLRFTLPILVAFLFMGLFPAPTFTADPAPTIVMPVEKSFYLTPDRYYPNEALTACAAGYHFASIWEIWYFSNFTYNTELGISQRDSGLGPPALLEGWVRSGIPFTSDNNCRAWNSTAKRDSGILAHINFNHLFSGAVDPLISGDSPWKVVSRECSQLNRVWCASDPIY